MDKALKKLKLVHEKISLGVLIHQHVRAAVEQAVQEEMAWCWASSCTSAARRAAE